MQILVHLHDCELGLALRHSLTVKSTPDVKEVIPIKMATRSACWIDMLVSLDLDPSRAGTRTRLPHDLAVVCRYRHEVKYPRHSVVTNICQEYKFAVLWENKLYLPDVITFARSCGEEIEFISVNCVLGR